MASTRRRRSRPRCLVHDRHAGRPVAAGALRAVHRLVGPFEQLAQRFAVLRAAHEAHRDARRDARPVELDACLGHAPPDLLGQDPATRRIRLGEEHDELVASEPGAGVDEPGAGPDDVAHEAQRPVAGEVPVAIVDDLEVVEVDHQQAERPPGALASRELPLEGAEQVRPRPQARQRVDRREAVGVLAGTPLLAPDRHADVRHEPQRGQVDGDRREPRAVDRGPAREDRGEVRERGAGGERQRDAGRHDDRRAHDDQRQREEERAGRAAGERHEDAHEQHGERALDDQLERIGDARRARARGARTCTARPTTSRARIGPSFAPHRSVTATIVVTANRNTQVPTRIDAVEGGGPEVGRVAGAERTGGGAVGATRDRGGVRLDGERLVGAGVLAPDEPADATAERSRGSADQRQGRQDGDQQQCEQRLDRHRPAPGWCGPMGRECVDRTRSAENG